MKKIRVTVRAAEGLLEERTTADFECAGFFDRYRSKGSPNTLTVSADLIEMIEVVDVDAGGGVKVSAPPALAAAEAVPPSAGGAAPAPSN